MVEIGLIASIIGVAGAGAKVSITLFQLASAIGSAGNEVRLVAADTNALSLVLTNLSNTLRQKRAAAQEGEQIAGAVLLLCRTVIEDSNELISHLTLLVQRTTTALNDAFLRVTWLFQKSKFMSHRNSLEALKSLLCLLITTMSFAAAVEVETDEASTASKELLQSPILLPFQESAASHPLPTPPSSDRDESSVAKNIEDTENDENEPVCETIASNTISSTELTLYDREDGKEMEATMAQEYGHISQDDVLSLLEIGLLQRRVVQYAHKTLAAPPQFDMKDTENHRKWNNAPWSSSTPTKGRRSPMAGMDANSPQMMEEDRKLRERALELAEDRKYRERELEIT